MRRAVLALSVIVALLAAHPASAEDQSPKPSVSTTGEATVYVKPDEVVLSFGVETFDPSLDKAKQQNDVAAARLVKAVREVGVEERHLQVEALQVTLYYQDGSHPVRGIQGYAARRSYAATLKDVKLLDKLVDAVLKNGANQLAGIEFRSSELRKHRDQARRLAAKAAREKAELLAGELGAQVGLPRTITEGGGFSGYWGGRAWTGGNAMAQNSVQVVPGGDGGANDGEQTTPLGQIAIRAGVSVTFDLK